MSFWRRSRSCLLAWLVARAAARAAPNATRAARALAAPAARGKGGKAGGGKGGGGGRRGAEPGFLVIGVQKCGTSTLAAHMTEHPQVLPPTKKELLFFNGHDHVPSPKKPWHCDPPPDA